jgi:hypothetical protein
MAAGILSAPGTPHGLCDTDCDHTDCAETRRWAATDCSICGSEINYGFRFYMDAEGVLTHAYCAETLAYDERRERREHERWHK